MSRYVIEYGCPIDGIDMPANVLDADGAFVAAYEVTQ